jgi:hypothetical protein
LFMGAARSAASTAASINSQKASTSISRATLQHTRVTTVAERHMHQSGSLPSQVIHWEQATVHVGKTLDTHNH